MRKDGGIEVLDCGLVRALWLAMFDGCRGLWGMSTNILSEVFSSGQGEVKLISWSIYSRTPTFHLFIIFPLSLPLIHTVVQDMPNAQFKTCRIHSSRHAAMWGSRHPLPLHPLRTHQVVSLPRNTLLI